MVLAAVLVVLAHGLREEHGARAERAQVRVELGHGAPRLVAAHKRLFRGATALLSHACCLVRGLGAVARPKGAAAVITVFAAWSRALLTLHQYADGDETLHLCSLRRERWATTPRLRSRPKHRRRRAAMSPSGMA